MHERSEVALRRALRQWQARQRNDGFLTAILVFISFLATLRFVFSHSASSAFVMGLFLLALVVSCLRLLASAAWVVETRNSLHPESTREIIDVEILAPSGVRVDSTKSTEHPGRRLLN